ncbi:ATP-binding cassette domain-containing protein [Ectothiorhodospiraceae bacterium WFHF3C12]|nr:ATP-binding cassette domain-containing protein [Ectothiorhodospiraceae bacterium WFHF3C12]
MSADDDNTRDERWHSVRIAAGFIWPYKRAALVAALALLFTAGITLSIGQGIRLLIDRGLATGSPALLTQTVLVFLALVVALAVGTFLRFYAVSWLGERVVADIRRRVFDHLIELHPGFFDTNRGLEIQSRLTTDTTLLQSVIGSSLSVALRNAVMLVGGLILLFVTNVKLSLIVLLAVPLVVAPILVFGRRVRQLSRSSQDRVADVGAYIGENLGQIRTVQAYNHQPHDKARFADTVEAAFDVSRLRIRQRAYLIAVVILLVLGAVGAMIWVGGMDVIQGRISGGELAAFVFYSVLVGAAVGSISEVIGELQRAAGAAERLVELLESTSEIQAPPSGAVPLPERVDGSVHIREVSFAYPSRPEVLALEAFSLDVRPGETLALVGPSGAGKSTLFDLLLRFFDPQQGRIELAGHDLRMLDPRDLRRQFALVSQTPALFHGTIDDNIRYGRPEASDSQVRAAAVAANAHDFIAGLPQGYATRLGDAGLGLSGGQKQRLTIARALLADRPILLLDEATSALDAQSEAVVQEALERLMQGRTTLVIAHRLATVRSADRIAVMDEGQLQAVGTHEQLVVSNPLYAHLAELQFRDDGRDRVVGAVSQPR